MSDAKVCESCGGVALPPEMEDADVCKTPGCTNEGKPLVSKEVNGEDVMICPECGGKFMKSANHSH